MKLNKDLGHFDISTARLPALPDVGSLSFGELSVPVNYLLDYDDPEDPDLSVERPAEYRLTGDQRSILIVVHASVPSNYRDIVLFHELVEAELVLERHCPPAVAHRIARASELMYASRVLAPDEFAMYQAWREKLGDRSEPLPEIVAKRSSYSDHLGIYRPFKNSDTARKSYLDGGSESKVS